MRQVVSGILALAGIASCVGSGLAVAQEPRSDPSHVQHLLTSDTALVAADVARVLDASHAAMARQAFHVTLLPNAGGADITYDIQMGPAGQLRYLREDDPLGSAFDDFTGQPAHSCSGAVLDGELVVEFAMVHDGVNPVDIPEGARDGFVDDGLGGRIKVEAHVRDSRDLFAKVFEMYGNERPLTVGPRAMIDGHLARALVTHHEPRPAELAVSSVPIRFPPELQDWLWIDVESLFIVRWEIRNAGASDDYGYVFTHRPGLDLHPPVNKRLTVPTCVE
jgi:hypothetical protein